MTWRRGEAGSTLIDRPKDAPVPDFTNGKERDKVALSSHFLSEQLHSLGQTGSHLSNVTACTTIRPLPVASLENFGKGRAQVR